MTDVAAGYLDGRALRAELAGATGPRHAVLEAELQLRELGLDGDAARIPAPRNAQERWAQHKYSILARDPEAYREFGQRVAASLDEETLARELAAVLQQTPAPGRLRGALEHLWGYVATVATHDERRLAGTGLDGMLVATQSIVVRTGQPYLLASTALSELRAFLTD